MERRLKRGTKLPKRLKDFTGIKNVPRRSQGTPPSTPPPLRVRRARITRNMSPVQISPQSSVASPVQQLSPIPGPSNYYPPPPSNVRRRLNFTPSPLSGTPSPFRTYTPRRSPSLSSRSSSFRSPSSEYNTTSSLSRTPSPFRTYTPRRSPSLSPRSSPFRSPSSDLDIRYNGPRYIRGQRPIPNTNLPSPAYMNALRNTALKRVFTDIKTYKRNPVEINYDQNNIPHVIIRRRSTYTKVPSSYYPSNRPSLRIPMKGAFNTKSKILRRLKALKEVKRNTDNRQAINKIESQIQSFIKKYNTYSVEQAGSGFPNIQNENDI